MKLPYEKTYMQTIDDILVHAAYYMCSTITGSMRERVRSLTSARQSSCALLSRLVLNSTFLLVHGKYSADFVIPLLPLVLCVMLEFLPP